MHEHSDWISANKRMLEGLIPITQFVTVMWCEHVYLNDNFHAKQGFSLFKVIRILIGTQIIMALYLHYVPFYSAKQDSCWNRSGIFVHMIAASFVYFILPISTIVMAVINLLENSNISPHMAFHSIFMCC